MKKNSTLILVALVVVLSLLAVWVLNTDDSAGGGKAMSDFAIENTNEIDKIIITEINGNKAVISKENSGWILNDELKARPENVELLLKTFKEIKVQSSVSKDLRKTIVANMAARHKKVEIFVNGRNNKTYYIGSPTKDHYGTYMLLEKNGKKSSEPYVTHIPGFNGFLESRFFTDVNDWKYSGVFVYSPEKIKEIEVTFLNSPQKSYRIKQSGKSVSLYNMDNTPVADFNKTLVEDYVLNYEKIFFNKVAEFNESQVDSILALSPVYSVKVTDENDAKKQVDFYMKPKENPGIDPVTGLEEKWDENYIYGSIVGEKEILVFQYFALGNIFSNKSYFIQN